MILFVLDLLYGCVKHEQNHYVYFLKLWSVPPKGKEVVVEGRDEGHEVGIMAIKDSRGGPSQVLMRP